jgi:hypothetical protein
MPGADVHVALGAADRLRDPRESVLAVDEHLERVAVPRRGPRLRPQPLAGRRERGELAVAPQPPHVVVDHRALDPIADGGVEAVEQRDLHGSSRTR